MIMINQSHILCMEKWILSCAVVCKGGMLMANMHSEADRVAEIDVGYGGRRI